MIVRSWRIVCGASRSAALERGIVLRFCGSLRLLRGKNVFQSSSIQKVLSAQRRKGPQRRRESRWNFWPRSTVSQMLGRKVPGEILQVVFLFSFRMRSFSSMMFKGQNTRSVTRSTAWRSRASFGLAYPAKPSLGVATLCCPNTIGITRSAEHRFSDRLRQQR